MAPHDFWQELLPADASLPSEPYADAFPVTLRDGRHLLLPIRERPDGTALASLIVSQASFAVAEALAEQLATLLREHEPGIVVGLPTLGLTLAAAVARHLGHTRYVPCGTSRKFWYDPALSAPMSSVTTPDERRLYLDPRMLPLLQGRRVVLIDDVISTGKSIGAGLALIRICGVEPVAIGAAMLQTDRWRDALGTDATMVTGVFNTQPLARVGLGWRPA